MPRPINLIGRLRRSCVVPLLLSLIFPRLGDAWNDKTHMAIAYVAYRNLNKHARDRVDELLVLHPLYKEWTKGAKLGQAGLLAFIHAATWPNCIQDNAKCPGYVADGTDDGMTPPVSQAAWQNVGFADRFMHKYWHFIRQPYAVDNQPVQEAQTPNLATQLQLLTDALASNADDALKSYDLAWVANLVGELHQPLNCISRFSAQHPAGDQNGREVKLRDTNLHDYWDNLLGTEDDLDSATRQGKSLVGIQDQEGWMDQVDIDQWMKASIEIAKNVVYAPSIVSADASGSPIEPTDEYHKAAYRTAVNQVVTAGHRLANLLNHNLK